MKVIDLLNKIANGEEVPKRIRIRGVYSPDGGKSELRLSDAAESGSGCTAADDQ